MLPSSAYERVQRDLARFRRDWQDEAPLRIHEHRICGDGTPAFSSEFLAWFSRERLTADAPESRFRLAQAMGRLRDVAPREHDVLHRVLSGEPTHEIRDWLNARAERGGHPERYSLKDTVVLIVSGADKIAQWY